MKLYLTLGGTMHDVAVAVWGMKGWYDYIRPVSALRAMADRGQRSDPGQPSYDPEGFELRPGFIELVTAASSAQGERHEHLSANVGEVAIKAWRGPTFVADPETDFAGVDWILASEWWPYQRPSFVTPPFAGFPSGHSAFSRAAALVLHRFTGSPYFPNGLGEFHAPQNEFLVFEEGPSQDVTLQFASYYDASDQTSLSRIWGGIHPPQDDLVSRHIGATIAGDSVAHAQSLFDPSEIDSDADGVLDTFDNCALLANPQQDDTDLDGVGDACDDFCVGEATSLTGLSKPTIALGTGFGVFGTGFGPNFLVRVGSAEFSPLFTPDPPHTPYVLIPIGGQVPLGTHPVQIVNPEGCVSQEVVMVEVRSRKGCGVSGFAPLLLVALIRGRRQRRWS